LIDRRARPIWNSTPEITEVAEITEA